MKNLHEDTTSGGSRVLENPICGIKCIVGNSKRVLDETTHHLRRHLIPSLQQLC